MINPIAQQGIHTMGYSEARLGGTHRTGPLCDGLRSPNRTVTPAGTTTIRMAGGTACIDNAPDTSSMAMSRTFPCRLREMAYEVSAQSPHWVPLHR
jgi:hypothetical protein